MGTRSHGNRSIVWNFFKTEKDDISKVSCNLCEDKISRGNRNKPQDFTTSNMRKHLYRKHKPEVAREEELLENKRTNGITEQELSIFNETTENVETFTSIPSSSSSSTSKVPLTMQESLQRTKTGHTKERKGRKISNLIGQMIAVDSQPFSMVEGVGFERLMKHLSPNYDIPSKHYFRENVVPDIYSNVMHKVLSLLKDAEFLSLSSDIWYASTVNLQYMCLAAHWLTQTFEPKVVVLRVVPFHDSHIDFNISEVILKALHDFKLLTNKIHLITKYNESNVAVVARETGIDALPCFLHTIQLILSDCVFEQRTICDLISNCRKIVDHFVQSPASAEELAQLQDIFELPAHELINDDRTRWASTYHMLKIINEQKKALGNYQSDHPELPHLNENEWSLIEKVVNLLSKIEEARLKLSKKDCLLSEIIPYCTLILMYLEHCLSNPKLLGLGEIIANIITSAKKKFRIYQESPKVIIATFLDPRFKTDAFGSNLAATSLPFLVDWMADALTCMQNEDMPVKIPKLDLENVNDDKRSNFDFNFHELIKTLRSEKEADSTGHTTKEESSVEVDTFQKLDLIADVNTEVDQYLQEPLSDQDDNILLWWEKNSNQFKLLGTIARKFLSGSPSSMESERLFRINGFVHEPKRAFSPDDEEKMMFLNYNLRLFEFTY